MNIKRLEELRIQAYQDNGYQTVKFRDGSIGVLKCTAKTVQLMNRFCELIAQELEKNNNGAGGTSVSGNDG